MGGQREGKRRHTKRLKIVTMNVPESWVQLMRAISVSEDLSQSELYRRAVHDYLVREAPKAEQLRTEIVQFNDQSYDLTIPQTTKQERLGNQYYIKE
jgi:hypothetical protein